MLYLYYEVGGRIPRRFFKEFMAFEEDVQDNIVAKAKLLETFGPMLGRPHVDILLGASHTNLKELRIDANPGV